MTRPQLLGMQLDSTGTDLSPLSRVFASSDPAPFRQALVQAFSFAEAVDRRVTEVQPSHGLELWDLATQLELHRIIARQNDNDVFAPGWSLILEKSSLGRELRSRGFWVLESDRHHRRRPWVIPDGLITNGALSFAVEFDHGRDIGRWASQLLKAARAAASPTVSGILFCFCFRGGSRASWTASFQGVEFTAEFRSLIESSCQKPVAVATVGPDELRSDTTERHRIAAFLLDAYAKRNRQSAARVKRLAELVGGEQRPASV